MPAAAIEALALAIRYTTAVTTRENVETPLSSERMTRFCPGSQGGVEWNGPAYHRASAMIYVNAIDWCTRPPKDVPRLPEDETATDGLTVRAEYRHDESNKRFFEGVGTPSGARFFSGQDTVAWEAIYAF